MNGNGNASTKTAQEKKEKWQKIRIINGERKKKWRFGGREIQSRRNNPTASCDKKQTNSRKKY